MKIPKSSPLLSLEELAQIFSTGYLYELKSFFIIEKDTLTYDVNRKRESFLQEAKTVREAYLSGHTIIVKNLEMYNEAIRLHAAKLGRNTNVHMYLVPNNGRDSFDFHSDDRHVEVVMVYGSKKFFIKDGTKEIKEYTLHSGESLKIALGLEHRAQPLGASCLLSFGNEEETSYDVAGGIQRDDLKFS